MQPLFGGIALLFFCVQVITGILLMFYYVPTPESAYESVRLIAVEVPFGWLIRSIHGWSSNLMVLSLFIHLFSVYFMRAYRPPRELTHPGSPATHGEHRRAARRRAFTPGGVL